MTPNRRDRSVEPEKCRVRFLMSSVLFLLHLQCGLALHRKCMEVCQLDCDHKKGSVFGVDLSVLPRDRADEVPFVVLHCTSEIESRALSVQVILIIAVVKMVTNYCLDLLTVFSFDVCLRGFIV